MKKIVALALALMMALTLTACGGNSSRQEQQSATTGVSAQTNPDNTPEEQAETRNILVAYYSYSGNTRQVATYIHESVGGDLFEIVTVDPYPSDYDAVTKQAKEEQESGYRPPLQTRVENMGSYDVVFIGYPNWWGTIPPAVATFLTEYDLSGKTIVQRRGYGTERGS